MVLAALGMGARGPVRAEEDSTYCRALYPNAHELFAPLVADPRELQMGPRYEMPVSQVPQAEADIGDYAGLYRWCLGHEGDSGRLQMTAGAGFFGQFDYYNTKNLEAGDVIGNLALDYRRGPWSNRFMSHHFSSHLGDDVINAGRPYPGTREFNAVKEILSYDASGYLRLYGAGAYEIESKGLGSNPWGAQGGFETRSKMFHHNQLQVYWANDLQTWGHTAWNPTINSQLGLKTANDLTRDRAVSYYVEFFSGHQPPLMYTFQYQTRWDLGIKFELSR
jgi:uncharacterized protein DUF1207